MIFQIKREKVWIYEKQFIKKFNGYGCSSYCG